MKAIIISGTPGTGKTTLSKALCKTLDLELIDVKPLVKQLEEGYDQSKRCYIVDEKKLSRAFIKCISDVKKLPLIDSHMSHFLPRKYTKLCIICRCNLKELKKRLEKKGYHNAKVRENLDCEIFEVCMNEAKEAGHNILVIDTTSGINSKLINSVKKALKQVRT